MNGDTLLYRQIHPTWVQDGRVGSLAFRPSPKDDGFLSVADGDQITAQAAWDRHLNLKRGQSCGVLAVQVSECEALELPVIPDGDPDPDHVSVDFRELSRGQIDKKARSLRNSAEERGWCFGPV